jgi:hypothetical protein
MPGPQKYLTFALIALPNLAWAQTATSANPSSIAAGKPFWVASAGDKTSTDALVDIGTMTQAGDELVVTIQWPYMPAAYGPDPTEHDRIVCQSDQALSFSTDYGFTGADGKYHATTTNDPVAERKKSEAYEAQWAQAGGIPMSYGDDPRSLACWAAARKCAGQKFTWPPPPNNTPLENTPQALKMNDAYNKTFIPSCTLGKRRDG